MFFRDKIVKFWVAYCLFVALSTEVLSIFNLIDRSFFLTMYVLMAVIFGFALLKNYFKIKINFSIPRYWIWYLIMLILVFVPLLLIALYYMPNNYDSLTYHLPRVENWIQNKNVQFYQTNNSRQLFMAPMTEYVILHWRILVGEDNLVNLVQYISMTLSVVLASLIVLEWKGNKLTQLLAAVLVATIPMGILQSTSTQNDYLTAFFAIASIYFYLRNDFLFLALCVGLGMFTKGTYFIFVLPLGFYWFITWIKKEGYKVWKRVGLIILFIFLINGTQWLRNYKYFNSMFGPRDMSEAMFNRSFKPKYIVSNIIKNIGTQIGLPNKEYNLAVDNIVDILHSKLELKTDDVVNSWYPEKYVTQFSIHEDFSGNILIFVLFLMTLFALTLSTYPFSLTYFSLFLGWLFFNVLLKWQPWQSRLMLPLFVTASPLIALMIEKYIKNSIILHFLVFILFICAIPYVVGYYSLPLDKNVYYKSTRPFTLEITQPWKPRFERFLLSGSYNSGYYEVVKKINMIGVRNIFLDIDNNYPQYPLYVALRHEKMFLNVNYMNSSDYANFCNSNLSVLLTSSAVTDFKLHKLEAYNFDTLFLFNLYK